MKFSKHSRFAVIFTRNWVSEIVCLFSQRRGLKATQEAKEKEQILERLEALGEAATTPLELLNDILPPNMASSLMNSENVF